MSSASEFSKVLSSGWYVVAAIAMLSGLINVSMLTSSLYMITLYDRVLPSHSIPTLVGITIIALAMYVFQAVLEILRGRLMLYIGTGFEESMVLRIRALTHRIAGVRSCIKTALMPLRDLDQVRSFLSSVAPSYFFDLPWIPLYLSLCFVFHYLIGLTAVAGLFIMVLLAIITELSSNKPTAMTNTLLSERTSIVETGIQNAEVIKAMGLGANIDHKLALAAHNFIDSNIRSSKVTITMASVSRTIRIALQSIVLGLGAYLVILQEASGGIMIVSSIVLSRALTPVEQVIMHWRGFIAARQGWKRLSAMLSANVHEETQLCLPIPSQQLVVNNVSVASSRNNSDYVGACVLVSGVSFKLTAGTGLGIIGPSAAGKSSLVKSLVSVYPISSGSIRLDGADIQQWSDDVRGSFTGYLPQQVVMMDGTIAENISRFTTQADPANVMAAANTAGVHEMITSFPNGYNTRIGANGVILSAGQVQRIGLARALYGDPFLIVLDEPNSSLDIDGEKALLKAVCAAKLRGAVVVVVVHRASLLNSLEMILMLSNGRVEALGPRDEILQSANVALPARYTLRKRAASR